MNAKALIIAGGEFALPDASSSYEYVIACDKGYEHAKKADLKCDLVIGDFDSYSGDIEGAKKISLPVEKDDTDTMAAVRILLEKGFFDITICCALGGRFDHSFANIQTAAYIAAHGGTATVIGIDTLIYSVQNSTLKLAKKEGYTLSVFSVSDQCTGVNLRGVKYELTDATMTNTFPIGVSNTWAASEASVTIGNGTGIVILSKDS